MSKLLTIAGTSILFLASTTAFAEKLDESKPFLGIGFLSASDTKDAWRAKNLPMRLLPKSGLMIASVFPASSAESSGLKRGDVLLSFNRRRLRDQEDLNEVMANVKVGDTMACEAKRFNGRIWATIKGEVLVGTERDTAYNAMESSESEVANTIRSEHRALNGRTIRAAPLIIVKDYKPELWLKVRWYSDSWLFMEKIRFASNGKSAAVDWNRFSPYYNSEILSAGKVMETYTAPMTKEVEEFLRQPIEIGGLMTRLDGDDTYSEDDLDAAWHLNVRTVLSVYDDLKETGAYSKLKR